MRYKPEKRVRSLYDRFEWTSWFAWHPVMTIDKEWVWLERVERISWWSGQIRHTAPHWFYWSFRTTQVPA